MSQDKIKELYYFADIIDKEIIIIRYANQNNRFSACFENSEIKEGNILSSVYGNGNSPESAILDYIPKISGKKLVFDAYGSCRKEFVVPKI